MAIYLHFKKFICKILTCWMPYKQRILYREALFWFTFSDYIRFKNTNYTIVSLGSNCLPRGLTTAIKLKPRRFYGEKSCPFDFWSNHDLNRVIELIENDFADFFKNLSINEGTFPHDFEMTYENFVERYQNRINNFKKTMQSDKILYFVYSNYNQTPTNDKILKLYNVLQTKRGNKPFKLILLTSEYIEDLPNVIQIPENFSIDDGGWLVYMINEYGDYHNKYTRYCNRMKNALLKLL